MDSGIRIVSGLEKGSRGGRGLELPDQLEFPPQDRGVRDPCLGRFFQQLADYRFKL